jgi:hypothetical protein
MVDVRAEKFRKTAWPPFLVNEAIRAQAVQSIGSETTMPICMKGNLSPRL